MANAPQLTTDQQNFCRAVEAMKLDLLRSGKEAGWLVAHPGVIERAWGQVDGELCGLQVVESSACPPGAFYVTHRRPDGAWPAQPALSCEPRGSHDSRASGTQIVLRHHRPRRRAAS